MSKVPCKHLDNLLPSNQSGKIGSDYLTAYANSLLEGTDPVEYETECSNLEAKLIETGFNPTETHLIMDRMVSGMSIKELSKKYGTIPSLIVDELTRLTSLIKERQVLNE